MTTLSATVLLFLVMDPIGNIPVFLGILSGLEPRRARAVLLRELLIALAVLIAFLFSGRYVLGLLQVTEPALSISGGVILFLIAIKMIFADVQEMFAKAPEGEPFIVPLAVPLIAGPSAMATVLLLMAREPSMWPNWLAAIVAAWVVSGLILWFASAFSGFLGKRGVLAVQRLAGMLLTTVAVQMFLTGIDRFFDGR
jgi:MarC family membrane protein